MSTSPDQEWRREYVRAWRDMRRSVAMETGSRGWELDLFGGHLSLAEEIEEFIVEGASYNLGGRYRDLLRANFGEVYGPMLWRGAWCPDLQEKTRELWRLLTDEDKRDGVTVAVAAYFEEGYEGEPEIPQSYIYAVNRNRSRPNEARTLAALDARANELGMENYVDLLGGGEAVDPAVGEHHAEQLLLRVADARSGVILAICPSRAMCSSCLTLFQRSDDSDLSRLIVRCAPP